MNPAENSSISIEDLLDSVSFGDFLRVLPPEEKCTGEIKLIIKGINPVDVTPSIVLELLKNHDDLTSSLSFSDKQKSLVRQMAGKLNDAERTLQSRAKKRKNTSGSIHDTRQISLKFEKALAEGCDLTAKLFVLIRDCAHEEEVFELLEKYIKEKLDQVVNGMEANHDNEAAERAIRATGSYSRSRILSASGRVVAVDIMDEEGKKELGKVYAPEAEEEEEDPFAFFDATDEKIKKEKAGSGDTDEKNRRMEAALDDFFEGEETGVKGRHLSGPYFEDDVEVKEKTTEEEIVGYLPGEQGKDQMATRRLTGMDASALEEFLSGSHGASSLPKGDVLRDEVASLRDWDSLPKTASLHSGSEISFDDFDQSLDANPVTSGYENEDLENLTEKKSSWKKNSLRTLAFAALLIIQFMPKSSVGNSPLKGERAKAELKKAVAPVPSASETSEKKKYLNYEELMKTVLYGMSLEEVEAQITLCKEQQDVNPTAKRYLLEWESMASNAQLIDEVYAKAKKQNLTKAEGEEMLKDLKIHGCTLEEIDIAIDSCDEFPDHHDSASFKKRWLQIRERYLLKKQEISHLLFR